MIRTFKYRRIRIETKTLQEAYNELQFTFPDKTINITEIKEITNEHIYKYNNQPNI